VALGRSGRVQKNKGNKVKTLTLWLSRRSLTELQYNLVIWCMERLKSVKKLCHIEVRSFKSVYGKTLTCRPATLIARKPKSRSNANFFIMLIN